MEDYEPIKRVMRAFYRAIAIFGQQFDYPGCSLNEAIIIGIVARNPGVIANEICGSIAIDRGYLSRLLKKLETEAVLTRMADEKPPFEKRIRLTAKGREIYRETSEILDESIGEHLRVMDDAERKAFFDNMEALDRDLKKLAPDV